MIPNSARPFNFDLGETADAIRETVAAYAQDKIAPLADKIDREDWFPRHLWPEMGALGLHGITVEEQYGGANMGYVAHCVAMEEVSRASASGATPCPHAHKNDSKALSGNACPPPR